MSEQGLIGTVVHEGVVPPEWIDINDHMNVAYYVLAFDLGVDALWNTFGITDDYITKDRGSTFAVECHVCYLRELRLGDPYVVTAREHYLAATAEWLNLHVSLESRRVTPWPEPILERIRGVADGQAGQVRPPEAGKQITIARPLYTL
jgi:acyl-CoA thioester hydrolase